MSGRLRIYLTHYSKEKALSVKRSKQAVTPDKLYTAPDIQIFMQRCQAKATSWGVLSDLYGVYLSDERHTWYEKPPDTVTPSEEAAVVQSFNDKLSAYDEICFFARPNSFHPFYKRGSEENGACG
ncbi:MAG: hypothetical protein WBD47_16215 [Phormidesmis sp.]